MITKRSFVSTGKSKLSNPNVEQPAPFPSHTHHQDDNAVVTPPDTIHLKEDDRLSSPSSSLSASVIPSDSSAETLISYDRPTRSRGPIAQLQDNPQVLVEPVSATQPAVSPVYSCVSPLNIVKKSPTASPLHQTTFNQEDQSPDIHTSAPPSVPFDIPSVPLGIPTTPSAQFPARTNSQDSDGETGIGLSLLQNLESGESDDESISEYTSVCHHEGQNDESTIEGLLYHNVTDNSNVPGSRTPTTIPHVSLSQGIICSFALTRTHPKWSEYLLNLPHLYLPLHHPHSPHHLLLPTFSIFPRTHPNPPFGLNGLSNL